MALARTALLLGGGSALLAVGAVPSPNNNPDVNSLDQKTYGLDASFPAHHAKVSATPLLGDRQDFYDHYMEGCRHHDREKCDETEENRIHMNVRQPPSMVNYTDLGFKKVKCPERVFKGVKKFWENHKGHEEVEAWFEGNTYTNHWDSPTYMLNVSDAKLQGGGSALTDRIKEVARHELERWTDQEVTPTSLYGVRKYTDGAVLATHVDRLPLVLSAVLNVDQDVDEPWPMELYGHDGVAYNVTLEPGEMLLYESHSVLHGRPFPLKGRHYANVFIHFEPDGHSLSHGFNSEMEDEHWDSIQDIRGGFHHNHGLPPYIKDGSLEAFKWRRENPEEEWEPRWMYEAWDHEGTGSNGAHYAANQGDIEKLQHIIDNPQHRTGVIFEPDANGWYPIHEAARGGHQDIMELLVKEGVDVNQRTDEGEGFSVLNIVYRYWPEEEDLINWLITLGAKDVDHGDSEDEL
ncbi:hypothetical protein ACHAWF_019006 [Thalassiosira exigua]